ncbi:MAG TPA: DUF4350 domain-containing protein [Pyrinomonadaceae bacterium]|jgi:hypothetical protein
MRERLLIIGSIAALVALLVGLNAVSYVQVEREPELEARPDRSTYNAGPTGTRALYEYLLETGQQVVRWREPATTLADTKRRRPDTFVVVGSLRVPYTPEEKARLGAWVAAGGRLVVIDRTPDYGLLPAGDVYALFASPTALPGGDDRAEDVERLTAGAQPVRPTQPTLLTEDVEQIAPTRFASRLKLRPVARDDEEAETNTGATGVGNKRAPAAADRESGATTEDESGAEDQIDEPPPPKPTATAPPKPSPTAARANEATSSEVVVDTDPAGDEASVDKSSSDETAADKSDAAGEEAQPSSAPVFHFADEQGALVADYRYGSGRVVVLSEPFVVANNGIERADNLQLALNLIAPAGRLVAFDEYHQGRAATENQLLAYFAGTPVLALAGQALLIALAVVWTRGRRFARPLPAPRADRRSKLEFVASMAELQQRARAYDLAIENVYARTRRALARYGGVSQTVPRAQLAARVAARSGLNAAELETLMRECEDAINGEPVKAARALELVRRLRALERTLGIRMRAREVRQATRL